MTALLSLGGVVMGLKFLLALLYRASANRSVPRPYQKRSNGKKRITMSEQNHEVNGVEALQAEVARVSEETTDLLGIEAKDLNEAQVKKIQERAQVRLHIRQQRNEERQSADQLKTELAAARAALKASQQLGVRDAVSNKAPISAAKARAQVDDLTFFKMSQEQKVALVGESPSELGNLKADAQRFFGRGSSSKDAYELSKSRPAYYNRIKQVALILGVYAA
jgi:hypothetical protein